MDVFLVGKGLSSRKRKVDILGDGIKQASKRREQTGLLNSGVGRGVVVVGKLTKYVFLVITGWE